MKSRTQILLVNLGTPKSLTLKDVKKYLKEFLLDPLVIDIPYIFRQILVRAIIVPFRAKKSLHAYSRIWTEEGSPLLVESIKLQKKLAQHFPDTEVHLAMRYGEPSLKSALKLAKKNNLDELIVVPLYPQYALSTTKTVKDKVKQLNSKLKSPVKLKFVEPFFKSNDYLNTLAHTITPYLDQDYILFSYHGLPKRHITKLDPTSICLKAKECCSHPGDRLGFCYRAQSVFITNEVAKRLDLPQSKYSYSFQSRLGKDWIEPFTDFELKRLADQGVKKLAVVCPSFVSDCLETLEEIQLQGNEHFKQYGGEKLTLIPCLNDDPQWVHALEKIIKNSY